MHKLEYPYLTIIVPAYNVENYIEQCLDSLIHQTEMNHKILVVNDGSTDSTGEIVHRYAKKYPKLSTVIDQENKGLGAARNRGLQDVHTPFVTFLDSDDWQSTQFVEKIRLLLEKQEEDPDIIFTLPWNFDAGCNCVRDWKDKELLVWCFFRISTRNGDSMVLNAKQERSLYALEPSTNRRVYRKAYLDRIGLRFTEGRKWEDVIPHFISVYNAERCIAIRDTGFFYRINTGTQITSGGGASRLDVIPVYKELLGRAAEEGRDSVAIAYIIRMMMDFCKWSINVTNAEYILPFLTELHKFFKTIPSAYFSAYLDTCPLCYTEDKAIIKAIRSPFYGMLKDYRVREFCIAAVWKLRKLVKRG